MFYLKTQMPNGGVAKTEITDENVYTRCPDCGRELPVDLVEVFSDGKGGSNLGGSAAQSVVLMVIVVTLTVIQFRFVEKKVQY